MHYKEIIKGVNAYETKGLNKASTFPKKRYEEEKNNYFDFLDHKKPLLNRVNEFLVSWNPRVPINRKKIKMAIKKVPRDIFVLDIKEVNLNSCYKKIINMYQNFINTGKSCKNYTGASKALHIVNPNFFPMWDGDIRYSYGCCENEEGYFNFMIRSQFEILDIIETYLEDFPNDNIKKLSNRLYLGRTKPILKLFDEYNWVKYRKGWI